MMLPKFTLSQTPDTLIITVRAPYCNLSELDADVYDNCFVFACSPYLLRITLPGSVKEDCDQSSFDADRGEFTFIYAKKYPGEEFKDLDAYSKFLVERDRPSPTLLGENEGQVFGFAMRGGRRFCEVAAEFVDVFEIDPTVVELKERAFVRMEIEQNKFNVQHYLFDCSVEQHEITEIIKQASPWSDLKADQLQYDPQLLDFIKSHPRKKYNLTPLEVTYCNNGLLDILFAYCYDRRTTYFEGTCESSWTISKLSATLSCFDGFNNPRETMISAFRRSLIYPLYRNFKLTQTVFGDLKCLLRLRERYIVRCLLEIYQIFLNSGRYVFNNLFIVDYIFYVLQWDQSLWRETTRKLEEVQISKECLGLNLIFIENCALKKIFTQS